MAAHPTDDPHDQSNKEKPYFDTNLPGKHEPTGGSKAVVGDDHRQPDINLITTAGGSKAVVGDDRHQSDRNLGKRPERKVHGGRGKVVAGDGEQQHYDEEEQYKSSSPSKKPRVGDESEGPSAAPKAVHRCSECSRQFWSAKALYGHMRCHPEREWRGINPPGNLQRCSGSVSIGGRCGSTTAKVRTTKVEKLVAASLVLMSGLPGPEMPLPPPQEPAQQLSPARNSSGPYPCSICRRMFDSYQALGGHRASHKNVRGCSAVDRGQDEADAGTSSGGGNGGNGSRGHHQCSICLMIFPTERALGDHVRRHWDKVHGMMASSSSSTPRVCLLDLNQLPPPPAAAAAVQKDKETASSSSKQSDNKGSSSSSEIDLDLKLGKP